MFLFLILLCFEGSASFKNIKFPKGDYQTDYSETKTLTHQLIFFRVFVQTRAYLFIFNFFGIKNSTNKTILDKKPTQMQWIKWGLQWI